MEMMIKICDNLIFKLQIFKLKKVVPHFANHTTALHFLFTFHTTNWDPHESGTPLQSPLVRIRTIKAPPSNMPHNCQLTFFFNRPVALFFTQGPIKIEVFDSLRGELRGVPVTYPFYFFVWLFPGYYRNSRTWFLEPSLGKTRFRLAILASVVKANILRPARTRWKSPLPLPPLYTLPCIVIRLFIVFTDNLSWMVCEI